MNSDAFKGTSYVLKNEKTNSDDSLEDTSISGLIQWYDDWNQPHPLQYSFIEIMDEGGVFGLNDQKLGTTYTDENGKYYFKFKNSSNGRNIYLNIYASGENIKVKTGTGNAYVLRTDTTYGVSSGSSIIRNQDIVSGYEITHAFQIFQALSISERYAKEMSGITMPIVNVKYPHNENKSDCFYRNNTIYILGASTNDSAIIDGKILHPYESWDVIQHEYNHHVQNYFDITNSPGNWHNGGNMYDHYMSHYSEEDEGECLVNGKISCAHPDLQNVKKAAISIAYAEAWASVVGAISQQYAIKYFNLDNNIKTVGDDEFDAYDGAKIFYENGDVAGEAHENSVCSFLWDLYDQINESFDKLSLGFYDFWNLSVNSGAKNISDLVNYFNMIYSSYDFTSKLGKMLSYYRIGPSNLNISLNSEEIRISWNPNGLSSKLKNDSFDVIFYDSNQKELLRVHTVSNYIILTQEQWNIVLYSYGSVFYYTVLAYQTFNPVTGGYYSSFIEVVKPKAEDVSLNLSISANNRYYEQNFMLQPNQSIIFHTTFLNGGNKMIQTFGSKDTFMYLYSSEGDLLLSNDDSGYRLNSFINYSFIASKEYIIKIKFYNSNEGGESKIAFLPVNMLMNNYSEIQHIKFNNGTVSTAQRVSISQNSVYLFKITTALSGNYYITTTQDNDCNITDTYLYFIDPEVTTYCYFNDDGGNGRNAALNMNLIANKEYLIIVSPFNITNTSGDIWLSIRAD